MIGGTNAIASLEIGSTQQATRNTTNTQNGSMGYTISGDLVFVGYDFQMSSSASATWATYQVFTGLPKPKIAFITPAPSWDVVRAGYIWMNANGEVSVNTRSDALSDYYLRGSFVYFKA